MCIRDRSKKVADFLHMASTRVMFCSNLLNTDLSTDISSIGVSFSTRKTSPVDLNVGAPAFADMVAISLPVYDV